MAKVNYDRPIMVYRNTVNNNTFFSYQVSKKNKEGKYINGFMPCEFKKDMMPTEKKTYLLPTNAWTDFYISKIGDKEKTNNYIFINDYEIKEMPFKKEKESVVIPVKEDEQIYDPFADIGSKVNIDDDFLE